MRVLLYIAPLLLGTVIGLSACSDQAEPSQDNNAMQDLMTKTVKEFTPHEADQHDILLLTDYEDKFDRMSDETEDELLKMHEAGTLSENFSLLRKRDNIRSALLMLKDLDLKTPQGRYIQGIMYSYWEQQDQLFAQQASGQLTTSTNQIPMQGIGDFLHAHEQLEHWREQYPALQP